MPTASFYKRSQRPFRKGKSKRVSKKPTVTQVKKLIYKAQTAGEPSHWFIKQPTSAGSLEVGDSVNPIDLTDNISQGDGVNDRTGSAIKPTSLDIRYKVYRKTTASAVYPCSARIILFIWKGDSDVDNPLMTDILQDVSVMDCDISPYVQHHSVKSKFKILYDKTHYLGLPLKSSTDKYPNGGLPALKSGRIFIPSYKLPEIKFFASDSLDGYNKIYMMACGNYPTDGDESAFIDYNSVLHFRP